MIKSYFVGELLPTNDHSTEFNLQFKLKNSTLNTLLKDGRVHLNAHFDCLSTMQRFSLQFNYSDLAVEKIKDEFVYTSTIHINSSLLNKKVEVNYFILSNEQINNYSNDQMHPDFKGTTFKLEKGDILAVGITQTIHLEKTQLLHTNSIFRIAKNDSSKPFSIGMQTDQIEIYFPESVHKKIGQFSENVSNYEDKQLMHFLIQMVYYPTLIDVLHYLQNLDENDLEVYSSRDWYITLERKLHNMGQSITQLGEGTITTIAYQLLYEEIDMPWKALENISIEEESEQDEEFHDE